MYIENVSTTLEVLPVRKPESKRKDTSQSTKNSFKAFKFTWGLFIYEQLLKSIVDNRLIFKYLEI